MELKLGKMTGQDVAQWLGITYNTYQKNIEKQLLKLEGYCEFKRIHGGIDIQEIYIEEYNPKIKLKDDQMYYKKVQLHNCLTTASDITADLLKEGENVTYRRMLKSGIKLYGKTNTSTSNFPHGLIGDRYYVCAVRDLKTGELRELNDEENEILKEIWADFYKKAPSADILVKENLTQQLVDAVKTKDFETAENVATEIEERHFNYYDDIIAKFRDRTNKQIIRATKYQDRIYAWNVEEKGQVLAIWDGQVPTNYIDTRRKTKRKDKFNF